MVVKTNQPYNTLFCLWLLLLAGDIEINPGPSYRFPCTICKRPVMSSQRGVLCDCCDNWTHTKCCSISNLEYDELTAVGDSESWFCPTCLLSELPSFATMSDSIFSDFDKLNSNKLFHPHILDEDGIDGLLNLSSNPHTNTITVAHLNIRSLLPKIDILSDSCARFSSQQASTILTLSETWLSEEISDASVAIEGYSIHRKDRTSHGGGVAAYVPSHLKIRRRIDLEVSEVEVLWLELRFRLRRVLLGVVYRSPSNTNFLTSFEYITSRAASESNKSILLLGDFNCDVSAPSSPLTKQLNVIMEELQLTQLVSSPTRITANSSTIIDLIFSSERNLATSVASTPCDLSDHHIVSCQVNIKASRPIPSFVYSRSLNDYDIDSLCQDMQSCPWHVAEIFDDINDQVGFWEDLYSLLLIPMFPREDFEFAQRSYLGLMKTYVIL